MNCFRYWAAPVLLLVAGLTSVAGGAEPPTSFVFPEPDAEVFDAPDGRRWVRHARRTEPDGSWLLEFTPEAVSVREWKEKFSVGVGGKHMDLTSMRETFARLQSDPTMAATFSIEGDEHAFVVVARVGFLSDEFVSKVVRTPAGQRFVSYNHRNGKSGAAAMRLWTDVITNLPSDMFMVASQPVTGEDIVPDARPEFLERADPEYPPELKSAGINGCVTVGLKVLEDGTAADAYIIESDHPGFEAPVLAVVPRWRFTPGIRGGKPVVTKMQVPVCFHSGKP